MLCQCCPPFTELSAHKEYCYQHVPILQIVNSISEFNGGRDETVALSGHSSLSSLAASYTRPVNQIWRNSNNKAEIKTPTRASNTDPPVIVCRCQCCQVCTCCLVHYIMIINAVRWGFMLRGAQVTVLSSLYTQNTFEGLRFACTLHVVLAKCSSPWGTFLLPIGKPSLRRRRGAQPSCAWTYRFLMVVDRQAGKPWHMFASMNTSLYVITPIGNYIPAQ